VTVSDAGASASTLDADPAGDRRRMTARAIGLIGAAGVLVGVVAMSLAVGSEPIELGTVVDALVRPDPSVQHHLIVRSLRLPRTEVGLLVGMALGLAGGVMQGVARNPLADPGILGVNAGASLAIVVAIVVVGVGSVLGYVWFAFAGAAVAGVLVYLLGSVGRGGADPVKLTLAGAALTALLASITTAILLLDVETLDQYRSWAVGSIAGRDVGTVAQVAPFILAGGVLALVSAKLLNALALGDDVARSLGQRVQFARAAAAASVVLLVGAATALAGPIAFVGLAVPHAARAITGPDYRWVLPFSAVFGAVLLLGCDIIARVVARPAELPVGVVTALVGAPFFIALVRRRRTVEL
jgi:iron complex transport system permease protein